MRKILTGVPVLLLAAPATAWACGDEPTSQLARLMNLEVLAFGLMGASLLGVGVLVPAFLFGRAAPRCRACGGRTLARWTDGFVACAGCDGHVAVNGFRWYVGAWCGGVVAAFVATAAMAGAGMLSHRDVVLIVALWFTGGVAALAASRLATARMPEPRMPVARVRPPA